MLESVDNSQQWGRYSFIGIHPKAEIKVKRNYYTYARYEHCDAVYGKSYFLFIPYYGGASFPNFPNKPKLTGGLIGYFAYDTVRYMEQTVSSSPEDDFRYARLSFVLIHDEIVAFDHLSNKVVIIFKYLTKGDAAAQYETCQNVLTKSQKSFAAISLHQSRVVRKDITDSTSNVTEAEFTDMVIKAKEHIVNGDIFQIVTVTAF